MIDVVFGTVMYVVEGPTNGFDNMFLGYRVIAVPTGIVTSELSGAEHAGDGAAPSSAATSHRGGAG